MSGVSFLVALVKGRFSFSSYLKGYAASFSIYTPFDITSLNIEDAKFYKHHGFDFAGLYHSMKINFKSGRIVHGGSTITQQLAKNLYLAPSRTLMRKVREAMITIRLEKSLSKERILEIYLNIIEWGPGIYGAESAAQYYYHKSASQLTLSESIRLAAIIPNPLSNNPLDERNQSLKLNQFRTTCLMFESHWIDYWSFIELLSELNIPMPPAYYGALCRRFRFHQIAFLI